MSRTILIAALLGAPAPLAAATVEISTGPIWVNPGDGAGGSANVASFKLVAPSVDSDITWISGANVTDQQVHVQQQWTESKFDRSELGGIGARTLAGFKDADGPGPRGSTTETRGSGSTEVEYTPEGVAASAHVVLTAIGNLGRVPNDGQTPVVVDYSARAEAKDPLIVKAAQLAETGLGSGLADVFFGYALQALDISGGVPGFGQYSTASAAWSVVVGGVATSVMSLAVNAAGEVAVTGSPGVSIFRLDSLLGPLPSDLTTAISIASIEALLRADILPDNRLDTPLFFGALIEDAFDFDDSDLGLEAFRVTGDAGTSEPAMKIGYVPVPPAAAGLVLALSALGAVARRRGRPA